MGSGIHRESCSCRGRDLKLPTLRLMLIFMQAEEAEPITNWNRVRIRSVYKIQAGWIPLFSGLDQNQIEARRSGFDSERGSDGMSAR